MIISKTPYRISFFGGGTDYPEWFKLHGGAVLSTSIDCYSYISCRFLPGFYQNKYRVAYSQVENVTKISQITHPVVKAALDLLQIQDGLSIHHDGDLPACSGMGSSSTFTVGLLAALNAYLGMYQTPKMLANKAIHLEQNILKECVGVQDQIAASFGGFNHIQIDTSGRFDVQPVIGSNNKLRLLQDNLLLVFTGQTRFASHVAKQKVQAFEKKEKQLLRMREMVSEAISILRSETTPLDDFGRLLDDAWHLKRGLSDSISSTRIDEMYQLAKQHGALGGKLLGAGGGGFVLFYVPESNREALINAFSDKVCINPVFCSQGSQIVYARETRQYQVDEIVA